VTEPSESRVSHELIFQQQKDSIKEVKEELAKILDAKSQILVEVARVATKMDERKDHSDKFMSDYKKLVDRIQVLETHRSNVLLIGSLALVAIGAVQYKIFVSLPQKDSSTTAPTTILPWKAASSSSIRPPT
jgi:hypothetical protein